MDWTLEVVPVPVSDVEVAKRFYGEQLGFSVDHDTAISEQIRVVQLTPPGSGCSIVISTGLFTNPPGSVQGLQLVVSDLDTAREQLVERGVGVSKIMRFEGESYVEGRGGVWNSFVFFKDPDGNSWAIQERPADR